MLELSVIRDDLKEIKYYYAHKEIFEKASKHIGEHACIEKINKYNDAIRFAPARLYELYVSLYDLSFALSTLLLSHQVFSHIDCTCNKNNKTFNNILHIGIYTQKCEGNKYYS